MMQLARHWVDVSVDVLMIRRNRYHFLSCTMIVARYGHYKGYVFPETQHITVRLI